MNHRPLAFSFQVQLPRPSEDDRTSDFDRLKASLDAAGIEDIRVPHALLKRLPAELRKNNFVIPLVIGQDDSGYRLLDISDRMVHGIALDIGTTTIECALFELHSQKRITVMERENPQIKLGADVLSRAQLAIAGRGDELAGMLREGINSLLSEICAAQGIDRNDIYAMTVSGNTIMSHFFLGLDVSSIPVAPFTPVINSPFFCSATEAGVRINSGAVVYVFPNAGSYVGGDIISGMVYTEMLEQEEPVLFMDVGTNVEITLGCRDWIMVGAGAAGPALEGGVSDIGRKAENGTISSVKIDRATGRAEFSVMGGGKPEGICGSGLIDLVSELYSNSIIDQSGRFDRTAPGVVVNDDMPAYRLYAGQDKELLFTEKELQNFLRSKAGMFAFLYVFLRLVGMKISDIDRIYVSGALGCGINMESAVNIGMLPDIRRDRIIPAGNTSLKGASMVLIDSSLTGDVEKIRSLITYRAMAEDPDLLNVLQAALFIPHTNPEILKG